MRSKFYRKPYRIKKKKSILRNRLFWAGILFVVAVAAILYFLFFSNTFQIKRITVIGQEKVSKDSIKSFVQLKNIFFIDTQKIREDILNNFPQIAAAQIDKRLPDILNIVIEERAGIAAWCNEIDCFVIDKEGVAFEKADGQSDFIKIFGDRQMLNSESISQILKIQSKLKEILLISVSQADIVSHERINFKTTENWEIYFNLKGDLDWQITELNLVLAKQITPQARKNLEYIDLRFSRVYYK